MNNACANFAAPGVAIVPGFGPSPEEPRDTDSPRTGPVRVFRQRSPAMDQRRRVVWGHRIVLVACALIALSLSSAAWAIPAAQPAKAPPREAVANAGVTAPPPMKEAEIESQPIVRNRNKATADAAPGQKPSGLGLPRVAAALAGVIGLILLLRWAGGKLSRQPGVGRASSAVQVLVRAPVSGRQQVLLLKVGKRILVVGDSGSQMNPLSEITDADEVATLIGMLGGDKSDFASKTFDKVFRRARREMDSDDDDGRLAIAPEPPEDMPDPADAETAIDPRMLDTRGQIDGLARRVRAFSEQFAETKRRESL